MLGYFPDPYPDESFYSLCARYSDNMRYPAKDGVIRELFGKGIGTLVTFPTRLDYLMAQLPPSAQFTVDQFINEHTLFPYYAPFLSREMRLRLREAMQGDTGKSMHLLSGTISNYRLLPSWLRFCVACVEEDRKEFGECYWHRVHQVAGVEVCPTHQVFLHQSTVRIYDFYNPYQVLPAEHAVQVTSPQALDPSNATHQALLQVACDTTWLLAQHNLAVEPQELQKRYRYLLFERGLASYAGAIHLQKLEEQFQEHFSPELFALLFSCLDALEPRKWLYSLFHASRCGHPPIHHLLLMRFLGYSAERFFEILSEVRLFGEGPWPCLNPVCDQYQQPAIQECEVQYNPYVFNGRPRGIFACQCGFTYLRVGPDRSPGDRFRIGAHKAYGPVWEAWLRERWLDASMTLNQLASQLGVNYQTLTKQAVRLGLPFPRPGGREKRREARPAQPTKQVEEPFETRRARCRSSWLSALEKHPEYGVRMLHSMMPSVYRWLLAHDRVWLQEHRSPQPSKSTSGSKIPLTYWEQRDKALAEQVRESATRLRNSTDYPILISRYSIAADLHQAGALYHRLDKLPLTAKVLEEVCETREAHAIRRIEWVARNYLQQHRCPTRKQFIHRAGVAALINHPIVRDAIEVILAHLQESVVC